MKKSSVRAFLLTMIVSTMAVLASGWPSMLGVWKGNVAYVNSEEGYSTIKTKLVVTDQNGSLFRGFLVNEGKPETNWVVGAIQTSLDVSGGYEISFSISSEGETKVLGSGILSTASTPWTIIRLTLPGFHFESGKSGNMMVRGTLTKK